MSTSSMTVLTDAELRAFVAQFWNPPKPAAAPLRIVRVAADLQVGDWLHRPGGQTDVQVTRLNPETREDTLAEGRREVWSLGSCWVLDADEPVDAQPREALAVSHG
ncbi:hypothetical protein GCM10017559_07830 [Streptosporangium longisporum]|uniref:Uncharacterized protein n=1 Tax=Streptosporangium longisporum TaxID=46187 RepID=A0ABN3XRH3_9ACTN